MNEQYITERLSRLEGLLREVLDRLPPRDGKAEKVAPAGYTEALEKYMERWRAARDAEIAEMEARRQAQGRPLDGADGEDELEYQAGWMRG